MSLVDARAELGNVHIACLWHQPPPPVQQPLQPPRQAGEGEPPSKRAKKRERTTPLNAGEVAMQANHAAVRDWMAEGHAAIVAQHRAFFDALESERRQCGAGCAAIDLAVLDAVDWATAAATKPTDHAGHADVADVAAVPMAAQALCHRVLDGGEGGRQLVVEGAASFVLPPRSRAIVTSLGLGCGAVLLPLLAGAGPSPVYDLIVADPPWSNRSVERGGHYAVQRDNDVLLSLPVPLLLRPDGGLVALWVTHKPAHMAFINDVLLPNWGLEPVALWFRVLPNLALLVVSLTVFPSTPPLSGKVLAQAEQRRNQCRVPRQSAAAPLRTAGSCPGAVQPEAEPSRHAPHGAAACLCLGAVSSAQPEAAAATTAGALRRGACPKLPGTLCAKHAAGLGKYRQ